MTVKDSEQPGLLSLCYFGTYAVTGVMARGYGIRPKGIPPSPPVGSSYPTSFPFGLWMMAPDGGCWAKLWSLCGHDRALLVEASSEFAGGVADGNATEASVGCGDGCPVGAAVVG